MSTHDLDDLVERFSMGRLHGPELADFETHLLQCAQCQDAVRDMEFFLDALRSEAGHSRPDVRPGLRLAASTSVERQYLLVQAALPGAGLHNIGVLLLDADSDQLYCRFRRDYEEFAGEEADWFRELPDCISRCAKERGAQKCVEWMEASLSNAVLVSARKGIVT